MKLIPSTAVACFTIGASTFATGVVLVTSGIELFNNDYTTFPIEDISGITCVETADFDLDGYCDMVAIIGNNNRVGVFLNQSGTGFLKVWESPIDVVFNDKGVGVGDFNNDGYPDLISRKADAGFGVGAKVWMNQIPNNPVCASDLDKTGNVDFSDLLFVLNEWGECGQQIN